MKVRAQRVKQPIIKRGVIRKRTLFTRLVYCGNTADGFP